MAIKLEGMTKEKARRVLLTYCLLYPEQSIPKVTNRTKLSDGKSAGRRVSWR